MSIWLTIAAVLVALAKGDLNAENASPGRRVLTIARELGAMDPELAKDLAGNLGMHVFDRELLDQGAARLGLPLSVVQKIDEQPAGLMERYFATSLYHRYLTVLKMVLAELAARGNSILVGRVANQILRKVAQAFHVRLIAVPDARLLWVMKNCGLEEQPARRAASEVATRESCSAIA